MLDDRLAEGAALLGVGEGGVIGGACHADRLRRDADAAAFEVAERDAQPFAFLAQHLLGQELAIVEHDVAVIGRALAHRVLDARYGVARCPGRHDERRNSLLARRRIRDGEDQRDIGAAAGRDELLAAIQDEFVADTLGARRDGGGIGARARLGEAEGA